MASELGVSQMAVNRWESGAWRPSAQNVVAYLELLRRLAREADVEHYLERRGDEA